MSRECADDRLHRWRAGHAAAVHRDDVAGRNRVVGADRDQVVGEGLATQTWDEGDAEAGPHQRQV